MFNEFGDNFFSDPADEKEYEDMARGMNWAGSVAMAVLAFSIIVPEIIRVFL